MAHCDICQRQSKNLEIARPELHPIPVKSTWHHIGVDFVGPLSPPSSGNRYILTLTDYFSKFACVRALHSMEAGVVNALKDIFIFGIPAVITTDQGTEFKIPPWAEARSKYKANLQCLRNLNNGRQGGVCWGSQPER